MRKMKKLEHPMNMAKRFAPERRRRADPAKELTPFIIRKQ
jgi:hypothetical protein